MSPKKGKPRVLCAVCGGEIEWSALRLGWVHVVKPAEKHEGQHPSESR